MNDEGAVENEIGSVTQPGSLARGGGKGSVSGCAPGCGTARGRGPGVGTGGVAVGAGGVGEAVLVPVAVAVDFDVGLAVGVSVSVALAAGTNVGVLLEATVLSAVDEGVTVASGETCSGVALAAAVESGAGESVAEGESVGSGDGVCDAVGLEAMAVEVGVSCGVSLGVGVSVGVATDAVGGEVAAPIACGVGDTVSVCSAPAVGSKGATTEGDAAGVGVLDGVAARRMAVGVGRTGVPSSMIGPVLYSTTRPVNPETS